MVDVVVLGAGPAGLACAMLLARQGLDILVLDRDDGPPGDAEAAWDTWARRSVSQFRLVHYLQPAGRALLERHLPEVLKALESLGAVRFNPATAMARLLPGSFADAGRLERFETVTTCRRPLIDLAFLAAASRTTEIEIRRSCPAEELVTGLDGDPQGDAVTMSSTANTTREFVVDGVPCATGVIPLADAWGFTNPSLGRGITMALMHVIDAAPAIAEHIGDPRRLAEEWQRCTAGRPADWHDATVAFDRLRAPEVDALVAGQGDPFDPSDPFVAASRAFASASHYDPQVLEWFMEVQGCTDLASEVISRDGVLDHVIEVALANPPYRTPGPDRARLEEILA